MPGSFFDTNILLYVVSGDSRKADRAEELLERGGTISVQVLNEFVNVARRKLTLSWDETRTILGTFRQLLTVQPLTVDVHEAGVALAERYGFSFYDALIVASAIQAGCDRLWSEDLQNGMALGRRLRIVNPFAAT